MPFPSSTPPLQPIRTPLVTRSATQWNNIPNASAFGTGAPTFALTGANAGSVGYQGSGATGLSGVQLIPNAGADQAVRYEGSNNAQRWAASFIPLIQGGVNPFPGKRWEIHFEMGIGGVITPNAAGVDSQLFFGIGSDFGFVFSRPRGPWFGLSALGDGGANWRVWGIDGDLGSGGSVTVNVDTGVAYTATPQRLAWVWGNNGANNFVEARIDGAVVYNPTLPVGVSYPTTETAINFYAGVNRGADAADVVELYIADEAGPTVFIDVYP